jgi:6-phosphofructo-2-kinase/fructose-2,6-biphosphatase 4
LQHSRGKTHCGKALQRYLTWLGVKTRVFSLGDYRRAVLGDPAKLPPDYFARDKRSEATAKLRQAVLDGMEQIIEDWFVKENGQVAIYDANNGTVSVDSLHAGSYLTRPLQIKLRERLRNRFQPLGVHMFFLESVCDRDDIIDANIRAVKLSSPDVSCFSRKGFVKAGSVSRLGSR